MSRCWIQLEVVLLGTSCSDVKLFSKQLIKKPKKTSIPLSLPPASILSFPQGETSIPVRHPFNLSGTELQPRPDITTKWIYTWGWLSISIHWTMTLSSNLLLTCHNSIDYYYRSVSRWSCPIGKVLNLHLLHLCDRDMVWTWKESKGDVKSYSCSLEIPTPLLWTSWWVTFEAFLTSWLPYIWNFYWLLHSFIKYLLILFIKF